MAVDIVGGTLIGYFSLSGAPLLDLNDKLLGRDYCFSCAEREK